MNRSKFTFYTDWLEGIKSYPKEEQGRIALALLNYCAYGVEPDENDGLGRIALGFAKPLINRDYHKYVEYSSKKRQRVHNSKEEDV